MSGPEPIAATRRVALRTVWALTLAAFAVFCALYLPLRAMQLLHAPDNFEEYARRLNERGKKVKAETVLETGFSRFHPPCGSPYRLAEQIAPAPAGSPEAARRRAAIALYEARETVTKGGTPDVAAVLDALRGWPESPTPATLDYGTTAVDLAAALGLDGLGIYWNGEDGEHLLRTLGTLAYGAVWPGVAGCDRDMLVFSAGGTENFRMTRIRIGAGFRFAPGKRGFYAVLLDNVTGTPVAAKVFDIWDSQTEADRMAELLEGAPEGCVGLFAVADDASVNMTVRLENALMSFGLQREAYINGRMSLFGLRYSFAAIGAKGANRAIQDWSPGDFHGYAGHPAVCALDCPEATP